MKLLYFLYVLLFFQNVKFCSRTTPAFLCATLAGANSTSSSNWSVGDTFFNF